MKARGCLSPTLLGVLVEPLQFDAPLGPGSPQTTHRLWATPRDCGTLFPVRPADGSLITAELIDLANVTGIVGAIAASAPQMLQVNSTSVSIDPTSSGVDRVLSLVVAAP